jgi:hypothetical protein
MLYHKPPHSPKHTPEEKEYINLLKIAIDYAKNNNLDKMLITKETLNYIQNNM